jgi:FXSXX-COOH protein
VKTSQPTAETLTRSLSTIERAPLSAIPVAQAARIRRRIVDHQSLGRRLDVAAFNSSI